MFLMFKNMKSLAQLYIHLIQRMSCSITDEGKQNKILSRHNVSAPYSAVVKSDTPGLKATDTINNLGIMYKHINDDQKIRFHHNNFMVDFDKVSEYENQSVQKVRFESFENASNNNKFDTNTKRKNFDRKDLNNSIDIHGSNSNLSMQNNKDTINPVIENLQHISKNLKLNSGSASLNMDKSNNKNVILKKIDILTSVYRDEITKNNTQACLKKAINHLEFTNRINNNLFFTKQIDEIHLQSIEEARHVFVTYFKFMATSLDNNCYKFLNSTESIMKTFNTLQTRVKQCMNNSELLEWFNEIERKLSCLMIDIKNDKDIIFLTTSLSINDFCDFIIKKFSPRNSENLVHDEHEHKRGNEMPVDLLETAILDQNITNLDLKR